MARYNDTQIAAPLGVLGRIGGYLLGKDSGRGDGPIQKHPPAGDPPPAGGGSERR